MSNKKPELKIRYDDKLYDPLGKEIYEKPFSENKKSFFELGSTTLGGLAYNKIGNTFNIVGISLDDSFDPMKIGPLMVAHETLRILKNTSDTITICVQNDSKVKEIWDKTQLYVFEKVTGYYQGNIEAGNKSMINDYSERVFKKEEREADIEEFTELLTDYINQI